MKLSNDQIQQYTKDGLLYLPNVFSEQEVAAMKDELGTLMATPSPDIAYEEDGKTIRALHGCHLHNEFFNKLSKQARIVQPCMQLLADQDLYLHQFKVNVKTPFNGEYWPWHQDFVYWHMGDAVPTPKNLTAIVFLDEITEFNAPVFFIPGSQKEGSINNLDRSKLATQGKDWKVNFSTKPNYTIDADKVSDLIDQNGLISVKGPAGSVVFFDSNVIHASARNISPFYRRMIFLAYNACDNTPPEHLGKQRPEFLASHDYSSISPMDALIP